MTRVYGYVRISSTDQKEDRQLDAMESCAVPEKNVYVDKVSGKDFHRAQYQKMVERMRSFYDPKRSKNVKILRQNSCIKKMTFLWPIHNKCDVKSTNILLFFMK